PYALMMANHERRQRMLMQKMQGSKDPRFGKLPTWARSVIEVLEKNLADCQNKMHEVYAKEDTGARLLYFPSVDQTMPLPRRCQVQFGPEGFGPGRFTVRLEAQGRFLQVSTDHPMTVMPWASNVIHVYS